MNVIVKTRFRDKENNHEVVLPGQPLSVSKERGEYLIRTGLAVASNDEQAAVLKDQAPVKKK